MDIQKILKKGPTPLGKRNWQTGRISGGRIVRIFLNTPMGNGLKGLQRLADAVSINLKDLEEGNFVIFINRARTILKVVTHNNTYAYHRSESGPITLYAIQNIPAHFMSSDKFEMHKAVEEALTVLLQSKAQSNISSERLLKAGPRGRSKKLTPYLSAN